MRFRNHYHHPLLYPSSTMSHLLVFFKHSNTFTVIPSENISGDLNINSIVVVPYGARRKYRAVIKFIGSKASCEAVSEEIFSQPPKPSTPLSKGSPAKKTPTVMPIQSASCSSCVTSLNNLFQRIAPILNGINDEVKSLRNSIDTIERSMAQTTASCSKNEADIQSIKKSVASIIDRLPKKPVTKELPYHWISKQTVDDIHMDAESSTAFARNLER
uniref:Major sperm protein n=1 Tax=Heterorhabditis bacteriophora TaxID=37862 RepID=A0A1I7XLG8_HETBA